MALHSVPQPPDRNRRDIDKTVGRRKDAANNRLNQAHGDPIATVLALAQNLASAMGLLSHRERGEVLARVEPPLVSNTSGAYRAAQARTRGGRQ